MTFHDLLRLAEETTPTTEIVRRFGNAEAGLQQLLNGNPNNDVLELVLVILGEFCQQPKNGVAQFRDTFIELVQILGQKQVFSKVTSIVLQLPHSRANNIGRSNSKRLKRLIGAVYHLTMEILTLMPNYACNTLGQHFFRDLIALKNMPTITELDAADPAFDILYPAVPYMKVASKNN